MNRQRFIMFALGCLLPVVVVGWLLVNQKQTPMAQSVHYSLMPERAEVGVVTGGDIIGQTIPWNDDVKAARAEGLVPDESIMIADKDVNFDGFLDVAILTGVGYGGVNMFYDYYIFNPVTGQAERDEVLTELGNPEFDQVAKTITTPEKNGPDYEITTYEFKNGKYVKGETKSGLEE